jgi:hypothetical protein
VNYDSLAQEVLGRPRELVADWDEFNRERLPTLRRAMVGRDCVTDLTSGTRYCDPADWPFGGRDVAKAFVHHQRKAAGVARALHHPRDLALLDLPAPQFFAGPAQGELAYVDITACHYNLYRSVGCYNPGAIIEADRVRIMRGSISLDGVEMFSADHLARNSIVGFARTRAWTEYRSGHRVECAGWMSTTAPDLWAIIVLALQALAGFAVLECGAVYVATDGYIVPLSSVARLLAEIAGWGLSATVDEGEAQVRGMGSYQVGRRATKKAHWGEPVSTLFSVSAGQAESLREALNPPRR